MKTIEQALKAIEMSTELKDHHKQIHHNVAFEIEKMTGIDIYKNPEANQMVNAFIRRQKTKVRKYANHHGWSDVHPNEVVRVINDKCVEIREMKSELVEPAKLLGVGGFCGHFDNNSQKWNITSNPDAEPFKIRLHKDGVWRSSTGEKFYMSDSPHRHYDYNF